MKFEHHFAQSISQKKVDVEQLDKSLGEIKSFPNQGFFLESTINFLLASAERQARTQYATMLNDFVEECSQANNDILLKTLADVTAKLTFDVKLFMELAECFERHFKNFVGDLQGRLKTQITLGIGSALAKPTELQRLLKRSFTDLFELYELCVVDRISGQQNQNPTQMIVIQL